MTPGRRSPNTSAGAESAIANAENKHTLAVDDAKTGFFQAHVQSNVNFHRSSPLCQRPPKSLHQAPDSATVRLSPCTGFSEPDLPVPLSCFPAALAFPAILSRSTPWRAKLHIHTLQVSRTGPSNKQAARLRHERREIAHRVGHRSAVRSTLSRYLIGSGCAFGSPDEQRRLGP